MERRRSEVRDQMSEGSEQLEVLKKLYQDCQSFNHSIIQSIIHSINHSFNQSFIHSINHSFNQSFIHSINHSFNQSFILNYETGFTKHTY